MSQIDIGGGILAKNISRSSLKLNSDMKEHDEITVSTISINDIFSDNSDPILMIKIETQETELELLS